MSQRLLVLVGALVAAGCSTSNNTYVESKCGPGTVLVDGVCEAAGTDGGAASDSSAPSDASVGVADAEVGSADGASEAASPAGDPCPSGKINVNCSSSCGGPTANCALAACHDAPDGGTISFVNVKSATELPFVVRTPDRPGVDPKCGKGCSTSPNITYGMVIHLESVVFHVRVEPPWNVGVAGLFSAYCNDNVEKKHCASTSGWVDLLISTSDPNAPARNVVIESGLGTCP